MDVASLAATMVAMKRVETDIELQTRLMKQQIDNSRSVIDLLEGAAAGGSVTPTRGQEVNLLA